MCAAFTAWLQVTFELDMAYDDIYSLTLYGPAYGISVLLHNTPDWNVTASPNITTCSSGIGAFNGVPAGVTVLCPTSVQTRYITLARVGGVPNADVGPPDELFQMQKVRINRGAPTPQPHKSTH